jgi:hypothetical protein
LRASGIVAAMTATETHPQQAEQLVDDLVTNRSTSAT